MKQKKGQEMTSKKIKISGLQKTSLIDYPDKIATVLFTQGCNMDCPFCHNPALIPDENENEYMNLEYFWQYLEKRKDLIDGVAITGGEPLVQESIYDFIKDIKKYNLLVKLDTNGTNFKLLKKLIDEDLINYIAMDIKGPIKDYERFCGIKLNKALIDNIVKSKEYILNSKVDYELRTTVVPGLHSKETIRKIAQELKGVKNYYIQNFRSEKVNDLNYTNKRSFSETELKEFIKIFKDNGINAKTRN
ncbi:MAG: anaerobic ribonucleoside-triphosphate reductase activating protein [Halanaerobiales bacterium]|nr:anaerobic ribonucleoside-triphosphate reductase activating protein [Halanaerobiales bacterium]